MGLLGSARLSTPWGSVGLCYLGPLGVFWVCLSALPWLGERMWLSADAPEWDAPAALGAEGYVCVQRVAALH